MAPTDIGRGERAASRTLAARWLLWLWLALVVVLFCLPLFVGLRNTDLENDESIYSFSVQTMLKNGDWLTPRSSPSEDLPFLEKPPLKVWIVALPIRLGLMPNDEFGLRFWDVLFGSLAFLYVFAIGRRLRGPVCGAVAVLVLFAHTPLLFNHGIRGNNMEAALVLAYCGATWHFLAWGTTEEPGKRRLHITAICLFFVLAFLTKFVASLFLPMVLGIVVLFTRENRLRFLRDWRAWAAGCAAAVGLIAPWFLYEYAKFGTELLRTMVGTHVVQRLTGVLSPDHLQPWSYYVSMIAKELGPGALALAVAGLVVLLVDSIRRRSVEGPTVLLWAVLPIVLMSAMTSKLYHYAYPFLPAIALTAGYAFSALAERLWNLVGLWPEPVATAARAGPRLRVWLLLAAVAAGAVTVATYVYGSVRLAVGSVVLFRNTSVLRPAVAALLALAVARELVRTLRVGIVLAVVLLLPLSAYRQNLAMLSVENHPLRSTRDCLSPISAAHATPADPRGPGVYVEDNTASHTFSFYLRDLGNWFTRDDVTSDSTVYVTLSMPALMHPVLLSEARYRQFTSLVQSGDGELVERAARKVSVTPADLRAWANQATIGVLRFPADVLLLPGPYSACGTRLGPAGLESLR